MKSYNALKAAKWRAKKLQDAPDYIYKYNQNWRKKNPERYLLRKAFNHAKEAGREFNLKEEDIKIPTHCPILNIPLEISTNVKRQDNSPSIDRFDNSKGYISNNINVISWRANKLKSNGTLQEFRNLVSWMEKYGES